VLLERVPHSPFTPGRDSASPPTTNASVNRVTSAHS
jgi:hypothetical protein